MSKDTTVREHAQSIYRQTGKWPEDIPQEPVCPAPLVYLFDWFTALSNGRGSGGFGPSSISWLDLYAWCCVTGVRLARWELTALRLLDAAYMQARAVEAKALQ